MYELAPDVFACTTGRNCVFLDLRGNRYLSVSTSRMRLLGPLIRGASIDSATPDRIDQEPGSTAELADELLEAGVLCLGDTAARAPQSVPPAATQELPHQSRSRVFPVPLTERIEIFYTLAQADVALRRTTLWSITERIRTANVRPRPDLDDPPPWEVESATCKFLTVRPWYPRNRVCLFDSLALILYLGRHGIHASWIFAVREDPFAAHCWVQYRETTLNDHLDRTRLYKPIMAV